MWTVLMTAQHRKKVNTVLNSYLRENYLSQKIVIIYSIAGMTVTIGYELMLNIVNLRY